MIFDLTSRDSFLDIKNYWINEVESYTDANAQLVLVGNKSDSTSQVSQEEIKDFTESKGLLYFETSAKTGSNVREMFIWVAEELTRRTPAASGGMGVGSRTRLGEVGKVRGSSSDAWKNCEC